jgi:hypothetical protein
MIFNFFYLLHNLFTNKKIKCEEHILKKNRMFIMSHFALRYNELKHVVICNQQKGMKICNL